MFTTKLLQTPLFIVIASVIAFLLILLFLLLIFSAKKKEEAFPFYTKKPLTPEEQALYFLLAASFPVDYIILTHVALTKFLAIKAGVNYKKNFNKISEMTVDFLVCKKDSSLVAAIDLDNSSLKDKYNLKAYAKKIQALQAADVRVIKWNPENTSDAKKIKEDVDNKDLKEFASGEVTNV